MNQKAKKVLALGIVLLSAIWLFNFQISVASKTLFVPAEYKTISQAISFASNGDTIKVESGVYHENLQVNKSLVIIGENPETTLIIGEGSLDRGSSPVVAVNAENTKISGFTIQSRNYTDTAYTSIGIIIHGDRCFIQNNIIQDNYIGIFCSIQSNLQISNNSIKLNLKDGVRFYGGSFNNISDNKFVGNAVSGLALQGYSNSVVENTFVDNYRGLGLGSSYSVVYGNKIIQNIESGIFLAGSNNIVAANDIVENKWAIYITPQLAAPHDNTFYHNNFQNNVYCVFVNESSPVEFWDGGAQIGGNFWSDYHTRYPNANEVGNSGIADTPYLVYECAQDHYPLTQNFNHSKLNAPTAKSTPPVASKGLVASWSFDTVDSNGISTDSTGGNPAILGSISGDNSYEPKIVEGKFGFALAFDGRQYISVPASSSLELTGEASVDVWVNVQAYKEIPYNNILVECVRSTDALPARSFGIAINGEMPKNDSGIPIGGLRGYVLTNEGLNEIDTIQSVIPLNQWIHVVFTRSLTTGMHIYVNDLEQSVKIVSGVSNPSGAIMRQTETYIGHDAECTIDELKISNVAQLPVSSLWTQLLVWLIVFGAIFAIGFILYLNKQKRY